MTPTRIIAPPVFRKIKGASKHAHTTERMFVQCDDGKEYAVHELAEVIGITYTSLKNRIIKWGWDSVNVLSEVSYMYAIHRNKKEGTSEFSGLGYKSRPQNLFKIKVGSWEQAQL